MGRRSHICAYQSISQPLWVDQEVLTLFLLEYCERLKKKKTRHVAASLEKTKLTQQIKTNNKRQYIIKC